MVAVVLILPLKGKLWLPWKTADQKRVEFRGFFFFFSFSPSWQCFRDVIFGGRDGEGPLH